MNFQIGDRVAVIDSRHPYYRYSGIVSHIYVQKAGKYEIMLNSGQICDADDYQLDFDFNDLFKETREAEKDPTKCECGAEKTGQPAHSPWCPRYVDPMGRDK